MNGISGDSPVQYRPHLNRGCARFTEAASLRRCAQDCRFPRLAFLNRSLRASLKTRKGPFPIRKYHDRFIFPACRSKPAFLKTLAGYAVADQTRREKLRAVRLVLRAKAREADGVRR
jgi:hypothetical protein